MQQQQINNQQKVEQNQIDLLDLEEEEEDDQQEDDDQQDDDDQQEDDDQQDDEFDDFQNAQVNHELDDVFGNEQQIEQKQD